jgi:hypothetical protein
VISWISFNIVFISAASHDHLDDLDIWEFPSFFCFLFYDVDYVWLH